MRTNIIILNNAKINPEVQFDIVLRVDIFGMFEKIADTYKVYFPSLHITRKILRKTYIQLKREFPTQIFLIKNGFIYKNVKVIIEL